LFIVDFKLKKPDNKTLVFLVLLVAAAVIIVVVFSKYKVPKPHFFEKPLWKFFKS
jgi:CDP-diacylglycerol--serine O-phosphatidyltransferase